MKNAEQLKHIEYTEEYVDANADIVDWNDVCLKAPVNLFDDRFIERFGCELDWNIISKNPNLTKEFVLKHEEKLVHEEIIVRCKNLEDFVEEYDLEHELIWAHISSNKYLSENFIRNNKDNVNWWMISRCITLSEDFI